MQPQYSAQPPPPPMKQPRTDKAKIILLGALGLVIGLVFFGSCVNLLSGNDNSSTTPSPTATVTVTEVAEPDATEGFTEAPTPKKTAPPKPTIESTMSEGTYEIGVDAQAGRYKTVVPSDSSNCYWERLKDDRGGLNSIIANENLDAGARASITVRKGEFFNSSDCGTWKRVG